MQSHDTTREKEVRHDRRKRPTSIGDIKGLVIRSSSHVTIVTIVSGIAVVSSIHTLHNIRATVKNCQNLSAIENRLLRIDELITIYIYVLV